MEPSYSKRTMDVTAGQPASDAGITLQQHHHPTAATGTTALSATVDGSDNRVVEPGSPPVSRC